jgi:RHS repeat-associated protein
VARTSAGSNPTILSRTRYEPYGATAAGTHPNGIGFTGHVNDVDTGLVYMQQRYYEPIAGRFLSVDPVTTNAGDGSFFNRYVYANNNPYKFKDPDGNSPAHAAAFVLGFAIDVGAQMHVEGKSFGDVSFGDAALSGLGAAITGGIGGRLATAAMQGAITTGQAVAGTAAAGAVAGAGVSAASDLSKGQAPSAAKMAIGAAGGAAGAAAGAKIANSAAAKLASDAAKPGVAGHIGQTTQAAAQQGGKVVVPTSVGQEVGKAGADAAAAGASKLAEKELVK